MSKARTRQNDPYRARKGEITFDLGFWGAYQKVLVYGGPFDSFPSTTPNAFGVCVRSERVPATVDVHVPIRDFSVPTADQHDLVASSVLTAFEAGFVGRQVYVGCMGGMGRTGLFLAIMARCVGIEKPVEYVREHYYKHAVETTDQYDYVMNFDIKEVKTAIYARAWRHQIKGFLRDIGRAFSARFSA